MKQTQYCNKINGLIHAIKSNDKSNDKSYDKSNDK